MINEHSLSRLAAVMASVLVCLSAACGGTTTTRSAVTGQPWTPASNLEPSDLAHELAQPTGKPVVVYVGPPFLYRQGHIPGAVLHGAASTAEGLADLEQWARSLPQSTNLVIYCGCCPLDDCPNLKPAFLALQPMGFTRLRVLILPNNFATDWVEKGYPVER
jgi:poly(3-hydroxybutyrate) depolymerase